MRRQMLPQLGDTGLRNLGHHIRHEHRAPASIPARLPRWGPRAGPRRRDNGRPDERMLPQERFDLSSLDPDPEQLELMIEAAEEFEDAIGPIPNTIPGSIH